MPVQITASGPGFGVGGTERGAIYAGSYNGAIYVATANAVTSKYEMWRSQDSGATWARMDDAHAPAVTSYLALSACQVSAKIYISIAVYAPGSDEYGWNSDYYAIVEFDCASDTWGTPANGPRRAQGDYMWWAADPEQWSPRIHLAAGGSAIRMTYTWRRWNLDTATWEQLLGRWASYSGGAWSDLDSTIAAPENTRNKALGSIYTGGAFKNVSFSWNGGGGAPFDLVVDGAEIAPDLYDPWVNWPASITYCGYAGAPYAGGGEIVIPYLAAGPVVSVARLSGGLWTTEAVASSSMPPNYTATLACVYAAAGQTVAVIYLKDSAASVWCATFTAPADGLCVVFVSGTTVRWSQRTGGAWSAPVTLIADVVNAIDAGLVGSGGARTASRYYAL